MLSTRIFKRYCTTKARTFWGSLLVVSGIGFTFPVSAALFVTFGDTTGAPTFNRPTCPGFGDICLPTAQATNGPHRYQALRFRVSQTGAWQIGTTGITHGDTHLSLYQGAFNPNQPLQNVLLANDDNPIFGGGFDSGIVGQLNAGTNYTNVTSAFGSAFGIYLLSFLGPGTIILSDAEIATAAQNASITASRNFMGSVMRRLGKQRGNDNLYAANSGNPVFLSSADSTTGLSAGNHPGQASDSDASFWFTGYGGNISIDGEGGSADVDSTNGGFAFGYDQRFTDDLIAGVAVSAGRSYYDIDAFGSEGDSHDFNIAAYGSWNQGPWYVDGLLGYGRNIHDTERSITVGALGGSFDIHQLLLAAEVGYQYDMQRYILTPFVRGEVTVEWQDGYTESELFTTSSGLLPLAVRSRSFTAGRSILGIHGQRDFIVLNGQQLTVDAELGWAHEFNEDRTIKTSILGAPGFISSVPGAGPDSDLAVYSIAVEMPIEWTSSVNGSLFLGYHGQKGSDVTDHNGFGGIKLYF